MLANTKNSMYIFSLVLKLPSPIVIQGLGRDLGLHFRCPVEMWRHCSAPLHCEVVHWELNKKGQQSRGKHWAFSSNMSPLVFL